MGLSKAILIFKRHVVEVDLHVSLRSLAYRAWNQGAGSSVFLKNRLIERICIQGSVNRQYCHAIPCDFYHA